MKDNDPRCRVSVRSLERKDRVAEHLIELVDKRSLRQPSPCPQVSTKIHKAVKYELDHHSTTVTVDTLLARIAAHIALHYPEEAGTSLPSDSTMRRVINYYDPDGLHHKTAKRREQDRNRPDRPWTPIVPVVLGEYTAMDNTPINFMVRDHNGKAIRVHQTIWEERLTRSILGYDFVPVGASAFDHLDMVARGLRPYRCRPDTPMSLRLLASRSLPTDDMLRLGPGSDDTLGVPFVWPNSITVDQGSDYISPTFRAGLEQLGISLREVPPGTATGKAEVERVWRSVDTMWAQEMPGYLGPNVTESGQDARKVDARDLLSLDELRAEFEEWWVLIYQNRPHKSLLDLDNPRKYHSPNAAYSAYFDACGGIDLPLTEDEYIGLMPAERRTLTDGFIEFRSDRYFNDRFRELAHFRNNSTDKKWSFRFDPHDPTRVWLADPDTGQWLVGVSEKWSREARPFHSVLEAMSELPGADPELQRRWKVEKIIQMKKRKSESKEQAVHKRRQYDGLPRTLPPDVDPPRSGDGKPRHTSGDFARIPF